MGFFGNKIDRLIFRGNDDCTKGIPIGPVISDLIAEIITSKVDSEVELPDTCFGVRFKDDYRILCNSELEAHEIINSLSQALKKYSLELNEDKTSIESFAEGLFRPWIMEFTKYTSSLESQKFSYKDFKKAYYNAVKIHEQYPNKGTIEKLLSYLIDKYNTLNIVLKSNQEKKLFISLLVDLINKRPKSLPNILAIFEIVHEKESKEIKTFINEQVRNLDKEGNGEFIQKWVEYFKVKVLKENTKLKRDIFNDDKEFNIYNKVVHPAFYINDYVKVFEKPEK